MSPTGMRNAMGDSFCIPAAAVASAVWLTNPHAPWLGPEGER